MQTFAWILNGLLVGVVIWQARRLQKLEQSHRTSEEQYRTIFDAVTDGLIINGLDGKVVEANPAACQMHGYTREEFVGQSAAEFVHPDSLHLFHEYVESLSAGRDFHCYARDLRKDGTAFDVEVNGVPFQFGGSLHLLGIVRDVTQRKQITDALKHSEELNRRIVEAVPAGLVHVSKHGAILKANQQAQEFLGLSLDKLTKLYVQDYQSTSIYEDGRECDPTDFPVSLCLKTGEKHGPLTLGVTRPDGTRAWALFVAVPVHDPESQEQTGAIVTILDITTRKQAEQDLLESEEKFRLLAENVPGVIYLCLHDERYTMLYLNEAVEQLTGYCKEEFLRDRVSFVDLYHSDDKHRVMSEVNAAIAERRVFRLRYRLRHREGEFRWVEEMGLGVWRDNTLLYLEGFLDDVTDRVRAETALRKTQEALIEQQRRETESVKAELQHAENRLVQSTRLATIGKMAAQIAHEIRNPLGIIKNAAFFVRRKLPQTETKAHENLEMVQAEVTACVNIIENILSITKIQPPRKTRLELEPLIQAAFDRLRDTIVAGELVCRYEESPADMSFQADPGQFRQVFDNLLKNAAEAMKGQGEIRISARQTERATVIEVADTGPGVPVEQAEAIFEVFHTTKTKGTGLGLGICRQIIEQHGGTITLQPNADEGTGASFVIVLPHQNGET